MASCAKSDWVIPAGLIALSFIPIALDGPFVYAIRLVTSSAMALYLCLGIAAIRRRDIRVTASG
jgi:hypothetical protein